MLENTDERTIHDVMRARLALAIVSRRAHECPNKACGRKRRCLARLRKPSFRLNDPLGECRNMSEAEWRIVGLGMRRVQKRFERFYPQRDAELAAALNALPKKKREELKADIRAARERLAAQEANEPQRGMSYFEWLWLEEEGGGLAARTDVAEAYAEAIAYWAERGVKSALEIAAG